MSNEKLTLTNRSSFHRLFSAKNNSIAVTMNQIEASYAKRSNKQSSASSSNGHHHKPQQFDEKSVKSLDLDSDAAQHANYDDYASEPVPTPRLRPTPPKKPLRLSLQRAQSLQTVNGAHDAPVITPLIDTLNFNHLIVDDRKRANKRLHRKEIREDFTTSGKQLLNGFSRASELEAKYIESGSSINSHYQRKHV